MAKRLNPLERMAQNLVEGWATYCHKKQRQRDAQRKLDAQRSQRGEHDG